MINLGKVGKIIINEEAQEIIDMLHTHVGSTEWCGVMFYDKTKGNISKMKDLEFEVKFLYPMDIGSAVHTSHEFDGDLMNAYDIKPELMESSIGAIHTHHSMDTFFSTTDTDDLEKNAISFNYYISLIVNFKGKYNAKIAFPTKSIVKRANKIKNENGKYVTIGTETEETNIIVGDLEVINKARDIPSNWIIERVAELKKPKHTLNDNKWGQSWNRWENDTKYWNAHTKSWEKDSKTANTVYQKSLFDKTETTKTPVQEFDVEKFVVACLAGDYDERDLKIKDLIDAINDISMTNKSLEENVIENLMNNIEDVYQQYAKTEHNVLPIEEVMTDCVIYISNRKHMFESVEMFDAITDSFNFFSYDEY